MSILDATRQCVEVFDAWKDELAGVQHQQSVVNQFDRFKIWAGNIGVFAPYTASTDHRLQEHKDLRDVILKLLRRIHSRIEQDDEKNLPVPLQDTQDLQARVESGVPISPASSTSSLQVSGSSISDDKPRGVTGSKPGASAKEQLEAVSEIVDRLYRLSSLIRRPLKFTGAAKVARFSGKDDKAHQESASLESFMRWRLNREFPEGDEAHPSRSILINRLVGAVGFRRRRFLYQKRHVQKLQGPHLVARPNQATLRTSGVGLDTRRRTLDDAGSSIPGADAENVQKVAVAHSVLFSATEASEVPTSDSRGYASSSSSISTHTTALNRTKLDLPALPTALSGFNEIICPYCFVPLDRKQVDARSWR